MALTALATLGELVLLFVLLVPLGILVLGLGESLVRRRLDLRRPEHLLLAFYLGGGVFFVLASLPIPIFGLPLVTGTIILGIVGSIVIAIFGRERMTLGIPRRPLSPFALGIALGSLGLIAYFVVVIGGNLLPNTYDGSVQTVFVVLLLKNHTIPVTLAPFAGAGVVYPQGTAVWLSLPVLLFGWPPALAPVLLPPLFLALSVPAAYCWGARWGGTRTHRGTLTGILFAAFFGIVAAWPRLLVGGSYDFVFAVPLAMVLIGGLPSWLGSLPHPWSEVVGVGVLLGISTSLSVAVGEALVVLLMAFLLLSRPWRSRTFKAWIARVVLATGVGALFLVRSLAGILVWFSYPGHVLTESGNLPYAPLPSAPPLTWGTLLGQLDPFVLWDPDSPVPFLDVEIILLLLAGLGLVWAAWGPEREKLRRWLPDSLWRPAVTGAGALFLLTLGLMEATAAGSPLAGIGAVSSVIESSILLFMFYQVIAILPLGVAAYWLDQLRSSSVQSPSRAEPRRLANVERRTQRRTPVDRRLVTIGLALVVALPLVSGLVVTVGPLPSYLHSETTTLANVTQDDLDALAWAGSHLPVCSSVLISPGSAAQFLPAYGTFRVVYPMNPAPRNLSYFVAVENLSAGVYSGATRSALLSLGITEVFVTGASTKLNPPFEMAPLRESSDFSSLVVGGDAAIFAFVPGEASTGCSA